MTSLIVGANSLEAVAGANDVLCMTSLIVGSNSGTSCLPAVREGCV